MKRLKYLVLFAIVAFPGTASAGLIYNYAGTCAIGCTAFGLTTGGSVTGFIEVSDSALDDGIISGGFFGSGSELLDWLISFGDYEVNSGNSVTTGALIPGPGAISLLPGLSAEGLFFNTALFEFGVTGSVEVDGTKLIGWAAVKSCGWFCLDKAGGPGEYAAAIPEPGILGLMGGALLLLGSIQGLRGKRR